jgi:hypothetical protein
MLMEWCWLSEDVDCDRRNDVDCDRCGDELRLLPGVPPLTLLRSFAVSDSLALIVARAALVRRTLRLLALDIAASLE